MCQQGAHLYGLPGFLIATCSEVLTYSDILCTLCSVAGYCLRILLDVYVVSPRGFTQCA